MTNSMRNSPLNAKKQESMALFRQNRMQEARALAAEICAADESDPEIWGLLGDINRRLNLPDEAVACYRRVIALRPAVAAAAYVNLGLVFMDTGKPADAARSFRQAIRIDPQTPNATGLYQLAALQAAQDESLTIRIRGGVDVCVPGSLQLMTPYILLEQEDWFEEEIGFIRRLMRPGVRVIDIGANFGVYALTMAREIGDTGRLWAFEPASRTASHLRRSIEANRLTNVVLIQAALSDRAGTARLSLKMNSELNSLGAPSDTATQTETVQVTTLDACLAQYGWDDIDFVKLDAEGQEENIVLGGADFFSTQSPLVMFELKHVMKQNLPLIERFRSYGYASYRLVPGPGILVPFAPDQPVDDYQLNLFCCKPDRAGWLEQRGMLLTSAEAPDLDDTGRPDAWSDRLRAFPYAAPRLAEWMAAQNRAGTEPTRRYYRALHRHARARDPETPLARRYARLRDSLADAEAAVSERASAPRMHTLARLQWELGQRIRAVETLTRLFVELNRLRAAELDEPFLTASPRFEQLDPGADARAWCLADVLEQHERLRAYSSYFSGMKVLPNLDQLATLGFAAPEMERRRQLVRMRHGLQDGPRTHPALAGATAENLNPGYWQSRPLP